MKLTILCLLFFTFSCNNAKQEVLPQETVTTVSAAGETKHYNKATYTKFCLEDSCHCVKDVDLDRAVPVSCNHFDVVQKAYNKLNNK